MKQASYPGWALEQVEANRARYGIAAHVKLSMCQNVCRCGCIVVMHSAAIGGGVVCVACGAHGRQRTAHPCGNMEAFYVPVRGWESDPGETHGTSCNPVADALMGL